jgi:hypothetical protein
LVGNSSGGLFQALSAHGDGCAGTYPRRPQGRPVPPTSAKRFSDLYFAELGDLLRKPFWHTQSASTLFRAEQAARIALLDNGAKS